MAVPVILRSMPAASLYRAAELFGRAVEADRAGDRERAAAELDDATRDARQAWHEQGCPV